MKLLLLLFLTLFFFSKPSTVFAGDVVINEFLVDPEADQWVELYNKGTFVVDISGWKIDDSSGSQAYNIPAGTTINSGEFKVFSSSYFNLNRASADKVRLLNASTEEDSYSYPIGPGTNNTYGRVIDGTGSWGIFTSSTKGSTNNVSSLQPTSTTEPTVVPTPTKTPTPTKNPTPTKTPTTVPTKIPTSTKTPTPTINKTVAETNSDLLNDLVSSRDVPTAVLGERTEQISKTPTLMPIGAKETKAKGVRGSLVFIVIGSLLLLGCAILVFFRIEKYKTNG